MPLARLRRSAALTILAAASAAAQSVPSPPARSGPATGRIEGTVVISAALTARRPQFRIYSDPGPGSTPPAPPRDPLAAEVRNVIVYIDGDSSQFESVPTRAVARRASIVQRDERFVPHVAAITRGGTVEFPNDDDVFHNVFSLSSAAGARGFDLGRYPKGTSRGWTFPRSGIVQVFCHIHQDMSATVLVLANPFFASPDETRRFAIDDVPEGEYTLVGWHERIKPITRRVRVVAGQTTTVDFNIPLPQGTQRP
jgi:plastocyanin